MFNHRPWTLTLSLLSALLVLIVSAGAYAAPEAASDLVAESTAPAKHAGLRDPSQAKETAPEVFWVRFNTTKGSFVVEAHRKWSPEGADRLYNLARIGYFQDVALFRVIAGFMVQFGIHGDPTVSAAWREATITDDPVIESNQRAYLTFAKTGAPNSRSTQFFINFGDNKNLDRMGFSPVGKVVKNMKETVDNIYSGYGEGAPRGLGPDQTRMQMEGNTYLKASFPEMDYIKSVEVSKKPF